MWDNVIFHLYLGNILEAVGYGFYLEDNIVLVSSSKLNSLNYKY